MFADDFYVCLFYILKTLSFCRLDFRCQYTQLRGLKTHEKKVIKETNKTLN